MEKIQKLNILLTKAQRQALERTVKCVTGKAMDILRTNVLQHLANESNKIAQKGVDWQFSREDTRCKLRHLYSSTKIQN